jgi:hypothetical protein
LQPPHGTPQPHPPIHTPQPGFVKSPEHTPMPGHMPPPAPVTAHAPTAHRPVPVAPAASVAAKPACPRPQPLPHPRLPYAIQNPLVPPTRLVLYGLPISAYRVDLPRTTVNGRWLLILHHIRARRFDAAQELLDAQMALGPMLEELIAILAACEQASAPAAMQQGLRGQTLGLALAQTTAGAAQPLPWVAVARFSLEDGNDTQFRQATQALVERFPENEYALFFNGVRQLQDRDWPGAEQSLRRAGDLGVPASNLAELLKTAIDNQRPVGESPALSLVEIAWLGGLGLLFVTGMLFSQWTRKALLRNGPLPSS